MIRVAMISFWHVHARDYARQATEHPETEIVAVWDELAERGRVEAEKLGARLYSSLDELRAQPAIDGGIIDTPTRLHPQVISGAAASDKHTRTQNELCVTLGKS